MRFSTRMIIVISCLLLLSCSTTYIQHARAVKACRLQCKAIMLKCERSCRNNSQECAMLANTEAAVHFNQYKHQQCVKGGIVALELQSFRDPLQCRKPTCDCSADLNVCVQACQSRIHKRLQTAPPC